MSTRLGSRSPALREPRRPHSGTDRGGGKQEYGTPPAIFHRFGKLCTAGCLSTVETRAARRLHSKGIPKAKDGFTQEWYGVVWLNPRNSGVFRWVAKALAYAWSGGTVIALLPVLSDAPWFHDFMPLGKITLLRGKLSYLWLDRYAPFPSMIVEWNSQTVKRGRASRWMSCWIPACVSVRPWW